MIQHTVFSAVGNNPNPPTGDKQEHPCVDVTITPDTVMIRTRPEPLNRTAWPTDYYPVQLTHAQARELLQATLDTMPNKEATPQ